MSSAQLAASAAFRALNHDKKPDSNATRTDSRRLSRLPSPKPPIHKKPEIPSASQPRKPSETPNLSLAAATKTTQAQLQKQPSRKPSLRIDIGSGSSTPPLALATSAADFSARNQKPSFDPNSVYSSPAVRTPAAAAAVSSTEKLSLAFVPRGSDEGENVSLSSGHHDYFGLPKTPKPESSIATPRLRHSVGMDPKEMLDSVKQSINSKAKASHGVSKDTNERSRAALAEFRQTVEMKRRALHLSHESGNNSMAFLNSPNNDLYRSASSLVLRASDTDGSLPTYEHHIFNIRDFKDLNRSRGSMESYVSGSEGEAPTTPSIAVVDTDRLDSVQPRSSSTNVTAAIPVPPSSNAVAREAAVTGGDIHLSPLPTNMSDTRLEENVKKNRRKPPPDILESELSPARYSLDRSNSNALSGMESDDKLPQFPDIREKKKHHHRLFGKKRDDSLPQAERSSFDLLNEIEAEEETPPETKPTRGVAPVVTQPRLALKTTMRKTNKRKERKKAFDENKPWKNHDALDGILASERKRYEGVWVSNKGRYMDKVVTRLAGVDYSKNHSEDEKQRKRELMNVDALELAARLSSAAEASSSDTIEDHIQERHGLKEADPHELIHGIVVKRIWKRSRLPDETLAAIWDLVDFRKDGTLNKIEFIVGMWLVDQCLYGRKLPKKVEELVWNSLGNIGLNVVIRKKKR